MISQIYIYTHLRTPVHINTYTIDVDILMKYNPLIWDAGF